TRQPTKLSKGIAIAASFLLTLIALIPVCEYYAVVLDTAVNVPYEDDLPVGLQFISEYQQTRNLGEKLRLIYAQHNEHRIVPTRLAFLIDYTLFGEMNFRHIALLGNLSLLFTLGLLFQSSFRHLSLPRRLLYFVPVPFLLFQLHYWELIVRTMASISS